MIWYSESLIDANNLDIESCPGLTPSLLCPPTAPLVPKRVNFSLTIATLDAHAV
jgi:hypothetical protein